MFTNFSLAPKKLRRRIRRRSCSIDFRTTIRLFMDWKCRSSSTEFPIDHKYLLHRQIKVAKEKRRRRIDHFSYASPAATAAHHCWLAGSKSAFRVVVATKKKVNFPKRESSLYLFTFLCCGPDLSDQPASRDKICNVHFSSGIPQAIPPTPSPPHSPLSIVIRNVCKSFTKHLI